MKVAFRMSSDINDHIRDYIDRYLAGEAKYALLLAGDWGSGKTYLIRNHLRTDSSKLIISANGVASIRDLVERLYLAAYPVLGDKTMQALGSIAKTVAGAFRLKSDLKMEDLFDLDKIATIIVDDIERSKISVDELFGFLNEFVEHDDKHLILIGNENEIPDKERYAQIKEKVVGFTITVEPDYEAILDKLTIPNTEYSKFLELNRQTLTNILKEGGLKNLRIIENSIDDAEGVFKLCVAADIPEQYVSGIYFYCYLITTERVKLAVMTLRVVKMIH